MMQNNPLLWLGFNSSARFTRVNTLYWGQCYLVVANKLETSPSFGTGTALMMNLIREAAVAWLYLLPNAGKSENAAVVDKWNYPLEHFELKTDDFLKLTINKELHMRQSSEASPCTDLNEETFYEVS